MKKISERQQKKAPFFLPDNSFPESEKNRFYGALQALGGSLTFKLYQDEEGWTAQCNEVDGIIASDTNPKPTSEEIENGIREAVYAAFSLKEIAESPFFAYGNFKLPQSVNQRIIPQN